MDSKDNEFVECRSIIQFSVTQEIYDWFFNGRTGYRAQFYIDSKCGLVFNRDFIDVLTGILRGLLLDEVEVRLVEVEVANGTREERVVGERMISSERFIASLVPDRSKLWICEWLHPGNKEELTENIGFSVLSDAARYLPKLCVPRWARVINPKTGQQGEGLRAPFPGRNYAWIDLKGGFVGTDGQPAQIKDQTGRARQLHETGWT